MKRFYILNLLLLFLSICSAQEFKNSTWLLQDYNQWNLPFAKEVYLKHDSTGNFTTYFYERNYLLKVDATAVFSILWQEKIPAGVDESDLIDLDYNYYGDESYSAKGIWSSATMNITDNENYQIGEGAKQFSINITIFLAYGKSPETGLDGLLALGQSNIDPVCIVCQLEEQLGFRTVFIEYVYNLTENQIYEGHIILSTDERIVQGQAVTLGGQIVISDQIETGVPFFNQKIVNPFLKIGFSQVQFEEVLLQDVPLIDVQFSGDVFLTLANPATHLPREVFNYMQNDFFTPLCEKANTTNNPASLTQLTVPLQSCQCASANYYGMPDLQLTLKVNGYKTPNNYVLPASEYELFPKINQQLRVSRCDLGLWSLQTNTNNEGTTPTTSDFSSSFGLGQNFIRKYGLILRFDKRAVSNEISVTAYIGNAEKIHTKVPMIVVISLSTFLLLVFLANTTVMRFRRIKREKEEYELLQLLQKKKGNKELAAEINLGQIQMDKAFLQGKMDRIGQEGFMASNQASINRNENQNGTAYLRKSRTITAKNFETERYVKLTPKNGDNQIDFKIN